MEPVHKKPRIQCTQLRPIQNDIGKFECFKNIDDCMIIFIQLDDMNSNGRTDDFVMCNQSFHFSWYCDGEGSDLVLYLKKSNPIENRILYVFVECQSLNLHYSGIFKGNHLLYDLQYHSVNSESFLNPLMQVTYGFYFRIAFVQYGSFNFSSLPFKSNFVTIPKIHRKASFDIQSDDDFSALNEKNDERNTSIKSRFRKIDGINTFCALRFYFTSKQIVCNLQVQDEIFEEFKEENVIFLLCLQIKTKNDGIQKHTTAIDYVKPNDNDFDFFDPLKRLVFCVQRPKCPISLKVDVHIVQRKKVISEVRADLL